MPIINLMKDIVSSIINEIFSREDEGFEDVQKDDVISFVLNRIPPKYCTSERGILHSKLDARFSFQVRTDIFFLIYEAIDYIRNRRKSVEHVVESPKDEEIAVFPHIMGMVLEEKTMSIIPDVSITLEGGDEPAKMVDSSWKNPYITNLATRGYYHFWPDFNAALERNENVFTVKMEHKDFDTEEIVIRVEPIKQPVAHESLTVPLVLMKAKNGVDVSYLYDEKNIT